MSPLWAVNIYTTALSYRITNTFDIYNSVIINLKNKQQQQFFAVNGRFPLRITFPTDRKVFPAL